MNGHLARALGALALALALLAPSATAAPDRTKPTTPGNLRVTAVTPTSVSSPGTRRRTTPAASSTS